MFGIPWEQCRSAAERSEEAVRKGFPASWPNLQCANYSYTGPDDTFNHVLSLAQGPHTLYPGLFIMVSLSALIASPSVTGSADFRIVDRPVSRHLAGS